MPQEEQTLSWKSALSSWRAYTAQRSPCHSQGSEKQETSSTTSQQFGENNWPRVQREGSHKVTHTPSEQTGGLTELPELEQDEKNQPWQGGRSLVPAGLGVERGRQEHRQHSAACVNTAGAQRKGLPLAPGDRALRREPPQRHGGEDGEQGNSARGLPGMPLEPAPDSGLFVSPSKSAPQAPQ